MSKSISIEPKTRTGHIVLGTVLFVFALGSVTNLFMNGFGLFNIIFAGLFVAGTIREFVKASRTSVNANNSEI